MHKIWLLSFVFLSFNVWSQSTNLRFHNLTVEDGLSHQTVTGFCQDKTGRMWIGTHEGLNMYDGNKIIVYRHEKNNPYSISNDFIIGIALHPNGNLIIATQAGINIYDPVTNNFSLLKNGYDTAKYQITSDSREIMLENSDSLWIATGNGLLLHNFKDSSVIRFVPNMDDPESISSRNVNNIYKDSRGNIWVGTIVGLNLYNRKENKFKRYLSNFDNKNSIAGDRIIDIYEDSQNILWISTSKGLLQFNYENETFIRFNHNSDNQYSVPLGQSSVILEDSRNRLWIAFQSALTYYDRNTNRFYKILPEEGSQYSLAGKEIWSIYEDNKGSIWFGTNGNGVSMFDYDNRAFRSIQHQIGDTSSLSSNMVGQIDEDSKGNLWIALKGDGINFYNRKDNQYIHFKHNPANPNSLSSNASLCLLVDHNDEVWVGTWGGGLNRYNPRTGKFKTYMPNGGKGCISGINVWYIFEDKQKNIWIGTHENGLNLFDRKTETFTSFSYDFFDSTTISHNLVWHIFEDSKNNLWLSTPCGLNLFNREKGFFKRYFVDYTIENDIKDCKNIVFMLEDSKNRFWLGRNDGLVLFDSDSLKHKLYDESNGLINKTVKGILEDKNGMLWVTTSNGLSKFNPETEEFKNYTTGNGLISNQFETKSVTLLSTGEFALGTQNGIQLFYPDSIKGNQYPPPVIFTGFSLFNEPVHIGDRDSLLKQHINYTESITLTHDQSVFTIYYAGLNYIFPEQNHYRYKMVGFDNKWNDVKNKTEATYTNLNPGTYIFRVKASNNDGLWNEESKDLKIIILPPWWLRWYMYILYFLTFTGILLYFRRQMLLKERYRNQIRMEQLKAEKDKEISKMKISFFTSISHEFRTPLTLIINPLEQLIHLKDIPKSKLKYLLPIMYNNAKRLLRLVNQIIDFRKMEEGKLLFAPENIDICDFVRQIVASFSYSAIEKTMNFSLEVPETKIILSFDKDMMDKILFNLLSNAFRYTPKGGNISLIINQINIQDKNHPDIIEPVVPGKYIGISVKDSGIGIEDSKISKLFDRFYQVYAKNSSYDIKGTGMGLALVKEYVNQHSGYVYVKSKVNEGAEFTVLLPYSGTEIINDTSIKSFVEGIKEQVYEEEDINDYKNLRDELPLLLIVDDNDELRDYIKKELSEGFNIRTAANGLIGYDMAIEIVPDIIISDVMMPEMDGIEMCKKIKFDEKTCHIPIVLLTAKTSDEAYIEGFGGGADTYLTKPFNTNVLIANLKNLLIQRKRLREKYQENFVSDNSLPTNNKIDNKFIEKLNKSIIENIDNIEFNPEQLASEIAVSRTVLYRKLKALTGQSVSIYIRNQRLKKAASLLKESDIPISEICTITGFSQKSYFAKCFKELFDQTPSEFRNRNI